MGSSQENGDPKHWHNEAPQRSETIGFGIGKVIPCKKMVHNAFIEFQYSIADKGAGYAKWQIFLGFNTQFKGDLNAGRWTWQEQR